SSWTRRLTPHPGKVAKVLLYYFLSAVLSILNKSMMGKDTYVGALMMGPMASKKPVKKLTLHDQLYVIIPTSLCSALDVGLSIASLHHISLSFYTIIKSAVPVWVLLFAFIFKLERLSLPLLLIILWICLGVGLTAAGEVHFSMTGFILIMASAIASGLRWCLHKLCCKEDKGRWGNPIMTIYRLSPATCLVLCVASWDWNQTVYMLGFIFAGGVVALLMTLSQFALVNATGVLTLSVTGIFKVIFMIIVSTTFFGDTITPLGITGVVISTLGVAAYTALKLMKQGRKQASYNKLSKD
ncbi:triose-phosphate transporter family-domain-containing protein, partial [Chytridium lagenaria]